MNIVHEINYIFHRKEGHIPILFLHGFLGSLEDWESIGESIKYRYSFILIDLPGHGKTDNVNSMSEAAVSIIDLLDKLGQDKVYLYGYSMGGRLALYLALYYPNRFKGVILESASPGLKTLREREERIAHDEVLSKRLETESLESFLSFWYAQPLFDNLVKQDRFQKLYQRRFENSPERLAQSLRTLGTGRQPSLWLGLNENKLPVQLLAGEYDLKFTAIAKEMCSLNQNIFCKIIEKSGHTIYIENQKAVLDVIESFII